MDNDVLAHKPVVKQNQITTVLQSTYRDVPYVIKCVAGPGFEFWGEIEDEKTPHRGYPHEAERDIRMRIDDRLHKEPEWQPVIVLRYSYPNAHSFKIDRYWAAETDDRDYWMCVQWHEGKTHHTSQRLPGEPGTVGPMYAVLPHTEGLYKALNHVRECYDVLSRRLDAGLKSKNVTESVELFAERLHGWLVQMGYTK